MTSRPNEVAEADDEILGIKLSSLHFHAYTNVQTLPLEKNLSVQRMRRPIVHLFLPENVI